MMTLLVPQLHVQWSTTGGDSHCFNKLCKMRTMVLSLLSLRCTLAFITWYYVLYYSYDMKGIYGQYIFTYEFKRILK